MCGIAGILTVQGGPDPNTVLPAMLGALRHRGPDDQGQAVLSLPGGRILGLVQARLAIQDLSSAAHQPMASVSEESWIVYNGEVYNHAEVRRGLGQREFRSSGDTETVLAGWQERGPAILRSLRGMFAFAVYDGRRRRLWLVRDRLGVKPLYLSRVNETTWLFASEVRALLASGLVKRRLDSSALESYLTFGSVAAPWTLVEGVESLLPAESWEFDLGGAGAVPPPQRQRYWEPSFAAADVPVVSRAEALERLRPVLLEAVRLRMVADVPVGVFLSGGIDSSSVVAALTAQGLPLHTFSVAFGEQSYDESSYARTVAQHFGTQHTELLLRPPQVIAEFDPALAAYDQPSLDGLNTYFIAQATRQAGVKVALSGLGGDELFAGYPQFRLASWLEQPVVQHTGRLLHQVLRWAAPGAPRTVKLGAVVDRSRSRLQKYVAYRQVLSEDFRRSLVSTPGSNGRPPLAPELARRLTEAVQGLDAVNAHSLLEISNYLANTLLRDSDQMSMAHSLELREPLLDHVLVEAVAGLPGKLKLAPGRHSRTKALLADALPAPLPAAIVYRRKMGFEFPWENWLRGDLRGRTAEVLLDHGPARAAGIDQAILQTFWNDFQARRRGIRATDVLCLVHLLHWVASQRVSF